MVLLPVYCLNQPQYQYRKLSNRFHDLFPCTTPSIAVFLWNNPEGCLQEVSIRQWGRKPLLPYPQKNEKRRKLSWCGAAFCLVPLFWPRKTKGLGLADDTRDSKINLAIAGSIYMIFTRCISKQKFINRYAFQRRTVGTRKMSGHNRISLGLKFTLP